MAKAKSYLDDPLTEDEFNELLSQGLTPEQIADFEAGNVPEGEKQLTETRRDPRAEIGKRVIGGTQALLRDAEWLLSRGSDPVARKMAWAASELATDPVKKARLKAIEGTKGIAYGSDVAEEVIPGLTTENTTGVPSNLPFGLNIGQVGTRIGIDVATDPLSFLGFGIPTKLGRVKKLVREAAQAGEKIKLDSKLAKEIAVVMKADKATPRVIKDFRKTYGTGGVSNKLSEQISKGERSLVSVGLPFTEAQTPLPGFSGEIAGKLVAPLSKMRRSEVGKNAEQLIRRVFSTKSGNADFDVVVSKFRDLLFYRKGLVYDEANVSAKLKQELSKDLGLPPAEIDKKINEIGEQLIPNTEKLSGNKIKSIYNDEIKKALDFHYTDKMVDAQVALAKAQKAGDQAAIDLAAKDVATYNGYLNELHGRYKPPVSPDPALDDFVRHIREQNAQQLTREISSGVDVREMLADRRYLPHIMTPEAKKLRRQVLEKEGKIPKKMSQKDFDDYLANAERRQYNKLKPEVIDAWVSAGLITKKEARAIKSTADKLYQTVYNKQGAKIGKVGRTTGLDRLDELVDKGRITPQQSADAVHTLGIEEVNSIPASEKIRMFGKDIPEIFHTDPIYHTTVRGIRGEVARTSAEFYNELKVRGLAVEDALAPKEWYSVKNDELKGFKVPPEVAPVLNRLTDFNTNPESVRAVLEQFDRYYSLHKLWTLGPFPAYHTMNAVGNFWNNFLSGLTNPDVYRQAEWVRQQRKVRFKDVYGKEWNEKSLRQAAKEMGVIDRGFYAAEVEKTIKQHLEKPKFWTLSRRNTILNAGLEVGKGIENNARMAHFIDRLRKGDTAEMAATSVKKFLFDYGDLTDIEKSVLNRTFFFYTWTRKNLPLQLQQLVHYPAKFSLPYKAKYEIEKETPLAGPQDERNLFNWMKDNFPIRTGYNKKTGEYQYFLLGRWLPATDILKLSHIHDVAANMINPLPKELIQQFWNYDLFFKREIERYAGETEKFLRVEMPKKVSHALRTIRLLNEIDKMSQEDQDIYSKIVSTLTGRSYSFNPEQAFMINKSQVDKEKEKLMEAVYRNAGSKHPSKKEEERLIKMIEDKMEDY